MDNLNNNLLYTLCTSMTRMLSAVRIHYKSAYEKRARFVTPEVV